MASKSALAALCLVAACGGGAPAVTTTTTTTAAATDSATRESAAAKAAVHPVAHAFDTAAAGGARPLVRETYAYEGSRRDPFQPLVVQVERGPELADLRLVAILYDERDPSGSIATFRDIGNDHRYTLTSGQRLGRISVVNIDRTSVKLREDDFGTARDQVYALRKPEDGKP